MEEASGLFSLTIDPVVKSQMNDISRWAKFISITGILLLVMGVVISILDATMFSNSTGIAVIINGNATGEVTPAMRVASVAGTIIFGSLLFFPLYFLLLFATGLKKALSTNEQRVLNESFRNLKKHFRYLGIVVICCLVFFLLSIGLVLLFSTSY
jgi:hypothetical protein